MTFYYQFDLFILFWPRALTLGKSQFNIEFSIFFKYIFNMIAFFKMYFSIYQLIDLLTFYLNKLTYFIFD